MFSGRRYPCVSHLGTRLVLITGSEGGATCPGSSWSRHRHGVLAVGGAGASKPLSAPDSAVGRRPSERPVLTETAGCRSHVGLHKRRWPGQLRTAGHVRLRVCSEPSRSRGGSLVFYPASLDERQHTAALPAGGGTEEPATGINDACLGPKLPLGSKDRGWEQKETCEKH